MRGALGERSLLRENGTRISASNAARRPTRVRALTEKLWKNIRIYEELQSENPGGGSRKNG
jgi:hypothetical protein